MTKPYRADAVRSDPRLYLIYSPENTAADRRYCFVGGEHTGERTEHGLRAAYRFVTEHPPTGQDYERAARDGRHPPQREDVVTYADGFGRWYARVDFSPAVGPDYMDREIDRIRAKARRAIRRELEARHPLRQPPATVRVEVTEDHWREVKSPDHMNQWWSITYREKG